MKQEKNYADKRISFLKHPKTCGGDKIKGRPFVAYLKPYISIVAVNIFGNADVILPENTYNSTITDETVQKKIHITVYEDNTIVEFLLLNLHTNKQYWWKETYSCNNEWKENITPYLKDKISSDKYCDINKPLVCTWIDNKFTKSHTTVKNVICFITGKDSNGDRVNMVKKFNNNKIDLSDINKGKYILKFKILFKIKKSGIGNYPARSKQYISVKNKLLESNFSKNYHLVV